MPGILNCISGFFKLYSILIKEKEHHLAVMFFFVAGTLKGTRTPDPLLRRQMLYPAELSAHRN